MRELIENTPHKLLWSLAISITIHLLVLRLSLSPGSFSGATVSGVPLNVLLHGAVLPLAEKNVLAVGAELPDQKIIPGASLANSDKGLAPVDATATPSNPPAPEILMFPVPLTKATYFRRAELTSPPVLLDEPVIDLPELSGGAEKNIGKLKLRLYINTYGEVDRGEIEDASSSVPSDAVAMAAFLGLRFRPGEIQGVAVRSQLVFEVDYDSLAIGASRSTGHSQILYGPK